MKSFWVLATICFLLGNAKNFSCDHDHRPQNYTLFSKLPNEEERRILLDAPQGPIRIKFVEQDWSKDILVVPPYYHYLHNLLQTAKQFFADVVNVTRTEGPLKFEYREKVKIEGYRFNARSNFPDKGVYLRQDDGWFKKSKDSDQTKCFYTNVHYEHISNGVNDTDLVVYVTAYPEREDYVSYSGYSVCLVTPRPTFAQLHINVFHIFDQYFDIDDPLQFQYYLEVIIHEMIHVLGFSADLYPYFQKADGSFYSADEMFQQQNDQTFIRLPSLTKLAQTYYGCDQMPGMALEDDFYAVRDKTREDPNLIGTVIYVQPLIHKALAYSSSHWERDLLNNELMTSSHVGQLLISSMTWALLQETNWYPSINTSYADQLYFGKGEGCEFVSRQCNGEYREYCGKFSFWGRPPPSIGCNYDYSAVSQCQPALPFGNVCLDMLPFENFYCFDESNNDPKGRDVPTNVTVTLEKFGLTSRCFPGQLRVAGMGFQGDSRHRCYPSACYVLGGQIVIGITVGNQTINCSQDGEVVQAPQGMTGQLACPKKLIEFCNQYQPPCKGQCNSNGYCLGAVCYCRDGWIGEDCNKCQGFKLNRTCVAGCPDGFFSLNNECLLCPQTCRTCKTNVTCTDCVDPLVALPFQKQNYTGVNCVENCGDGYYQVKDVCIACIEGCQRCSDQRSCQQCNPYYYTSTQKKITTCETLCPEGSYPTEFMQCIPCKTQNCSLCSGNSDCLRCMDRFWLLSSNQNKPTQCVVNCPNGYYNTDYKNITICAACSSNCTNCTSSQSCQQCNSQTALFNDFCLDSCPGGYYKEALSNKCFHCAQGCAECLEPAQCQGCEQGYLLVDGKCAGTCGAGQYLDENEECAKCPSRCNSCSNANICQACRDTFVLQQYQNGTSSCLKDCEPGYYYDEIKARCALCLSNCADCNTAWTCLACYEPFLVYDGNCVQSCPKGLTSIDGKCKACTIPNCEECSGKQNTCIKCDEGYEGNPCTLIPKAEEPDQTDQSTEEDDITTNEEQINPSPMPSESVFSNTSQNTSANITESSPPLPVNVTLPVDPRTIASEIPSQFLTNFTCHYSCQTCSDSGSSNCTACPITRSLIDGACPCDPSYSDTGKAQCVAITCYYSCRSCFSKEYHGCLTCPSDRSLDTLSNECKCNGDMVDLGKAQCETPSKMEEQVQSAFKVSQPMTELATQGLSIVATGGGSLSLGQNMHLSESSQKLGYLGYGNMPMLGTTGDQIKAQQMSNQPALFSMATQPSPTESKRRMLIQSESKNGSTLSRYGKDENSFQNLLTLIYCWLISAALVFIILNIKGFCRRNRPQRGYLKEIKEQFLTIKEAAYTIIFLSTLQEELFIIAYGFKCSNSHMIANISISSLLTMHCLASMYLLFRFCSTESIFVQLRRAFGLMCITHPQTIVQKIRYFIIKTFIFLKIFDKYLLVILAIFANEDPNYLIYILVLTIIQTILISCTFIFQSYLLQAISFTTDIFVLVIIFMFYNVQIQSNKMEDFRGSSQMNQLQPSLLKDSVLQLQTTLSIFSLYKICVFLLEIFYALICSRKSAQKHIPDQNIEAQISIKQVELQNFIDPNTSIMSQSRPLERPITRISLDGTQQFNSNSSAKSNQTNTSVMSYQNRGRQKSYKPSHPLHSQESYIQDSNESMVLP